MASHFKWYPGSEEVIVPWNAQYQFPSQANKSVKMTPRIPPKNGATFTPGQVMRVEFPAQGYVNPLNTTLEFDIMMSAYGTSGNDIVRFQNNIQSIFNRVRLLYGATPLEDVINYNVIVRCLTEWTGTGQNGVMDQSTIADGIGGVVLGGACSYTGAAVSTTAAVQGLVNVRQAYIQGVDASTNSTTTAAGGYSAGYGFGTVPNQYLLSGATVTAGTYVGSQASNAGSSSSAQGYCTRRYQINLALGLFTQAKLIPTKFMASQLAIEFTLENADACMFVQNGTGSGATPTYTMANVNLIPEILEFDASYDAMFLRGLREGGVPLLFSSWHTFIFSTNGASTVNLQVQERSRSVKALFAIQRRSPIDRRTDSHATLFDSGATGNSMQTYQWRIGGRYFPSAQVQLSTVIGGNVPNGGAEAFVELEKALNIMGDYRLSVGLNVNRWAITTATATITLGAGGLATAYPELDFTTFISQFNYLGSPTYAKVSSASASTTGNCFSGNVGSCCFTSAISLETSNGMEISGLNAEEQSDISFLANWSASQNSSFVFEVYSYYDAMIILRENNVIELIQ